MKTAFVALSCLGAASAFVAPVLPTSSVSSMSTKGRSVEMMAERSKSLPFLSKPPMVSTVYHSAYLDLGLQWKKRREADQDLRASWKGSEDVE